MLTNQSLTGAGNLDRLASLLSPRERISFEAAIEQGYLILEAQQPELQRLWTMWCMHTHAPDVRIECHGEHATVTMFLGPCNTTLSADGLIAIKRAFKRSGDQVPHYQTSNWCKHPQVPMQTSASLATSLIEIAYLDGVPRQTEPV